MARNFEMNMKIILNNNKNNEQLRKNNYIQNFEAIQHQHFDRYKTTHRTGTNIRFD